MDRRLPDTPWHVGYAKKEEDDPRRHKSRCIHNKNGICMSTRSHYCKEKCGGSSHCSDYAESYEEYEKIIEDNKTVEELARDNREKYRENIKKKKKDFVKTNNAYTYKSTEHIHKCLLCDEGLKKLTHSLKKCPFCGLYYVNIQHLTEETIMNEVKAEEVFIMNVPQKKPQGEHMRYYNSFSICKHVNKRNKCMFKDSKHYSKYCKEQGCPYYEKK